MILDCCLFLKHVSKYVLPLVLQKVIYKLISQKNMCNQMGNQK